MWSAEIFVASLNSLCAVNPEPSHGLVNMLTICIARQTHVRNSQCSLKLLQRETTNTIMLTMSCLGIAVFNIYHAYSTAKILFQIIDLIACQNCSYRLETLTLERPGVAPKHIFLRKRQESGLIGLQGSQKQSCE